MEDKNEVGMVKEEEVLEEEDEEMLKRKISEHPLFGLLIEAHLNCLKVGLGGEIGTINTTLAEHSFKLYNPHATCSELDKFMEVYCVVLKQLKEAMEESLQETAAFVETMYVQLRDLADAK